ncbi:MAG: hypothetical protein AB3N10_18305, partial [Allomuricauda sp.]
MRLPQINLSSVCILLALCLNSCVKDSLDNPTNPTPEGTPPTPEVEVPIDELEITELKIPANFDFDTEKEVTLTINDNTPNAKYYVYAYNDQVVLGEEFVFLNEEEEEETGVEVSVDNLNHLIFSGIPSGGS